MHCRGPQVSAVRADYPSAVPAGPGSDTVFEGERPLLNDILFAMFYLLAIVVVIAHYTGWLDDHNLEWMVFVVAVLVFPVVLML